MFERLLLTLAIMGVLFQGSFAKINAPTPQMVIKTFYFLHNSKLKMKIVLFFRDGIAGINLPVISPKVLLRKLPMLWSAVVLLI